MDSQASGDTAGPAAGVAARLLHGLDRVVERAPRRAGVVHDRHPRAGRQRPLDQLAGAVLTRTGAHEEARDPRPTVLTAEHGDRGDHGHRPDRRPTDRRRA